MAGVQPKVSMGEGSLEIEVPQTLLYKHLVTKCTKCLYSNVCERRNSLSNASAVDFAKSVRKLIYSS